MNLEEYLLEMDMYKSILKDEEASKRKRAAKELAKNQKKENKDALKFVGISPAKNGMKKIIFKDVNGKEIYPAILNTSLPLNIFNALIKMIKKELE
jgi:hypothetical protein